MTPAELAATLAPQVDRLVVAVHHHTRAKRRQVRAIIDETGVPGPALLVDLRPFLLEGKRVRRSTIDALLRFVAEESAESLLGRLAAGGHLVPDGADMVASGAVRRYAVLTTRSQAAAMAKLWSRHDQTVRVALPPLRAVVAGARDAEPALPVFGPMALLSEPDQSEPYVLHHLLTLMRYLRTDIHAEELAAAGLTPMAATVVDALWRSEAAVDAAPVPPGWIEPESGRLSVPGRRMRDGVEAATDERIGAVLGRIPKGDRQVLAAAIADLPS